MQQKEIICFTDGSCSKNGKPDAVGCSAVFFPLEQYYENKSIRIPSDVFPATNQRAELTAIIMALEATKDTDRPIHIYSDSKYSIAVYEHPSWNFVKNVDLVT